MTAESDRLAAYRAAIVSSFAPGTRDLGRIERDALPASSGDAIADIDTQRPVPLSPAALGEWANANGVALIGVAPWSLALGPPDENAGLRDTHARESELANVRSYTDVCPALADARLILETRVAPWLPLAATRRALVHVRFGIDATATASVVATLIARAEMLRGAVASTTIERLVPAARAIAGDLARASVDFRAQGLLTKLLHAAIVHRCVPDLAPMIADPGAAAVFGDATARLELDRALFHFAYGWAADPTVEPFVTYRGVRIDDLALRVILRRFGHPATEGE